MAERKTLAELVLEERLASPDAVSKAERRAQFEGGSLALLLIDAGVPEVALVAALRRRLRLPVVEVSSEPIDPEAIAQVPRELALRHLVLPLEIQRTGGRPVLRVAMANPLDEDAHVDLEYATGCRIEIAIATASAIAEALAYHYRGSVTKVIRENLPDPALAMPSDGVTDPVAAGFGPAGHTAPYHNIESEATDEVRIRALVNLLVQRGLLDEDEWSEEIRRILKERSR